MINHEYKFIFIHVPKTAGTSIGKALNKLTNGTVFEKSTLYSGFPIHHDDLTIKMLKDYYVFTAIRNPWDRHYSQYKFREWLQDRGDFSEVGFHYETYFKEFYDFSPNEFYLFGSRQDRANEFGEFCHLPSQLQFLNGLYSDGLTKVPFVNKFIRFENLNEDFKEVCNDLNIRFEPLLHYNKSEDRLDYKANFVPYREAYTDKLKEFVAKKYRDDIEYFNYEF